MEAVQSGTGRSWPGTRSSCFAEDGCRGRVAPAARAEATRRGRSEIGREVRVDLATAGDLNELRGLPLHKSYLRWIDPCRRCRDGAGADWRAILAVALDQIKS